MLSIEGDGSFFLDPQLKSAPSGRTWASRS